MAPKRPQSMPSSPCLSRSPCKSKSKSKSKAALPSLTLLTTVPTLPLAHLNYLIFNPDPDPYVNHWQRYSEEDPDYDPDLEMLDLFLKIRKSTLPKSKFMLGLLVPVQDLQNITFQFSHQYVQCTDLITIGAIMNQGARFFKFAHSSRSSLTIGHSNQKQCYNTYFWPITRLGDNGIRFTTWATFPTAHASVSTCLYRSSCKS